MHVANKELSEELYRLSGWSDTGSAYRLWNDGQTDFEWEKTEPIGRYGQYRMLPAYSLSYLLRKLPDGTKIQKGYKYWAWVKNMRDSSQEADTPEDALCSLAIELFKQKILTRES